MSSDPFKLVTDRRFQELRDEAHRDRLIRTTRTGAQPRRRDTLMTLVKLGPIVAWARKRHLPADTSTASLSRRPAGRS